MNKKAIAIIITIKLVVLAIFGGLYLFDRNSNILNIWHKPDSSHTTTVNDPYHDITEYLLELEQLKLVNQQTALQLQDTQKQLDQYLTQEEINPSVQNYLISEVSRLHSKWLEESQKITDMYTHVANQINKAYDNFDGYIAIINNTIAGIKDRFAELRNSIPTEANLEEIQGKISYIQANINQMLSSTVINITGRDLHTIVAANIDSITFARGNNVVNAPNTNHWYFTIYSSAIAPNQVYQSITAQSLNQSNNVMWIKTCRNGNWSNWSQILTGLDSLNSALTPIGEGTNNGLGITKSAIINANNKIFMPNGNVVMQITPSTNLAVNETAPITKNNIKISFWLNGNLVQEIQLACAPISIYSGSGTTIIYYYNTDGIYVATRIATTTFDSISLSINSAVTTNSQGAI